MRIDMDTGTNATVVTDFQPTRPIEQGIGSNPAVLSYLHITIHITLVINTRSLTKSQALRTLPPIREQFSKRQIPFPFFPYPEAEVVVKSNKCFRKTGRFLHE